MLSLRAGPAALETRKFPYSTVHHHQVQTNGHSTCGLFRPARGVRLPTGTSVCVEPGDVERAFSNLKNTGFLDLRIVTGDVRWGNPKIVFAVIRKKILGVNRAAGPARKQSLNLKLKYNE